MAFNLLLRCGVVKMVQLIKKGGLRERANRSRSYQGSENTQTTLEPNRYRDNLKNEPIILPASALDLNDLKQAKPSAD